MFRIKAILRYDCENLFDLSPLETDIALENQVDERDRIISRVRKSEAGEMRYRCKKFHMDASIA